MFCRYSKNAKMKSEVKTIKTIYHFSSLIAFNICRCVLSFRFSGIMFFLWGSKSDVDVIALLPRTHFQFVTHQIDITFKLNKHCLAESLTQIFLITNPFPTSKFNRFNFIKAI